MLNKQCSKEGKLQRINKYYIISELKIFVVRAMEFLLNILASHTCTVSKKSAAPVFIDQAPFGLGVSLYLKHGI